ncbi:uncharacterized protein C17orf50 homolog [Carettochelys insculpta]|uniref:uncharacterized protein C17orf50 homolog n=1 Tax=Carettochelys insculpta TaxID=44489 RepID=UPI003EB9EAD0
MSWSRKEEEKAEKEVAAEEPELVEEDTEAEDTVSCSPQPSQTSSSEQDPEKNKAEENWFWDWLSPFSLFSGFNTVCCLLDKKRLSGCMCPECKILYCRKCEVLHYNPAFIEHCILGHDQGDPEPRPSGLTSPVVSADSINLAAAPTGTDDDEIKRK